MIRATVKTLPVDGTDVERDRSQSKRNEQHDMATVVNDYDVPIGEDVHPPTREVEIRKSGIVRNIHRKLRRFELALPTSYLQPNIYLVGIAFLWGFTIYCLASPDEASAKMSTWQTWITDNFTWFYIGSRAADLILVYLYFAYGKVKLGKPNEARVRQQHVLCDDIFCWRSSRTIRLRYAEPLYHYDYWLKTRWSGDQSLNDNDEPNWALLMTLFHWGFHGWCVYTLVGVTMGVLAYRDGLPLLMRTCFYPILGRHTWGWIGDFIDGFSIVTIVAGVCTSLGLGTIQLKTGFLGLDALPEDCKSGSADAMKDCNQNAYLVIIWVITAIATASVLSGIKVGIKTLSQMAFYLGIFLLVSTLFFDETWSLLDNVVQMVGYYFQYAFTMLGWHTDAIGIMYLGLGGAPDSAGVGSNSLATESVVGSGASKKAQVWGSYGSYMDGWTIFYWGWWIAWSPFVGMFVSRISRGRTIREVINYTLTGPLLFSTIWFGIFGGAAIKMENNAQLLWQAGADLYGDPTWFQTGFNGNPASSFYQAYGNNAVQFRVEPCFGTGESGGKCSRCGAWPKYDATKTEGCAYDGAQKKWLYNGTECKPYCGSASYWGQETNPYAAYTNLHTGPFRDSGNVCIPRGTTGGVREGCGACFVVPATFGNGAGDDGCAVFAKNPANTIIVDGKKTTRPCPIYIKIGKVILKLAPSASSRIGIRRVHGTTLLTNMVARPCFCVE